MSSTRRRITLSQRDDDPWVAADEETGTTSDGETAAMAVLGLGIELGVREDGHTPDEVVSQLVDQFDLTGTTQLRALSERVQERFEAENVSDEDVEDAIEWARSQ